MGALRAGACLSTDLLLLPHSHSRQRRADSERGGVALLPQTHGRVPPVAAHADKSSRHTFVASTSMGDEGSESPTRQQCRPEIGPRARKCERCGAHLSWCMQSKEGMQRLADRE